MISVCMATKNGARYVRQQIDSILPQLSKNDELVISDDCSDDGTIDIVESYHDDRIKLFKHRRPIGIPQNFEFALRNSVGDFIFLSDQDDVWFPEKIEVMTFYLDKYDMVISDCKVADEELRPKHESFFSVNKSGSGLIRNLIRNSYMGCCMAFNRKVLEKAIPFPREIRIHDIWIGLVAECHFKPYFIKQSLMYHRRHSGNASSSGHKSTVPLRTRLFNRYNIIRNLVNR